MRSRSSCRSLRCRASAPGFFPARRSTWPSPWRRGSLPCPRRRAPRFPAGLAFQGNGSRSFPRRQIPSFAQQGQMLCRRRGPQSASAPRSASCSTLAASVRTRIWKRSSRRSRCSLRPARGSSSWAIWSGRHTSPLQAPCVPRSRHSAWRETSCFPGSFQTTHSRRFTAARPSS